MLQSSLEQTVSAERREAGHAFDRASRMQDAALLLQKTGTLFHQTHPLENSVSAGNERLGIGGFLRVWKQGNILRPFYNRKNGYQDYERREWQRGAKKGCTADILKNSYNMLWLKHAGSSCGCRINPQCGQLLVMRSKQINETWWTQGRDNNAYLTFVHTRRWSIDLKICTV